jgi:hypothetical protein
MCVCSRLVGLYFCCFGFSWTSSAGCLNAKQGSSGKRVGEILHK